MTLPAMVESMRTTLTKVVPGARELFEDALLAAGYLDSHAPRYSGRGYTIRAAHWFRVRGKFPRLVEAALPVGVGDTNYALSLAACEPFTIKPAQVLATLAGDTSSKKISKRNR